MAILSWGKPTIKIAKITNGTIGSYTTIDVPKEDTTKLTPTAGDKKEATQEGGGVVDTIYDKTTYVFEFTHYVKKGVARWVEDNDGIIAGEFAVQVIPEYEGCEGIQIDRCVFHVEENYTPSEGKTLRYVADCLEPSSGNTIKPYPTTNSAGA